MDHKQSEGMSCWQRIYRLHGDKIRFLISSGIAFVCDYAIYSLMVQLTGGMSDQASVTLSNVTARIISATINYNINRSWVFGRNTGAGRSAVGYFMLAAVILAANTLLLNVLQRYFVPNKYGAKALVEGLLFCVSWLVQRYVIFRKKS